MVAAIGRLQAAGLKVVPITGRPVGWSVPFASAWPVDSIVAENGAVALRRKQVRVMTAGVPTDMASRTETPRGSSIDGRTYTSARRPASSTSS